MDGQDKNTKSQNDENYAHGKSISIAANERLKEIRDEMNKGDLGNKYSLRDVLSIAVLEFPTHLIKKYQEQRVSGKESVDVALPEVFREYKESGGTLDMNEFLKKFIAPNLNQLLKQKGKKSSKSNASPTPKLIPGGENA